MKKIIKKFTLFFSIIMLIALGTFYLIANIPKVYAIDSNYLKNINITLTNENGSQVTDLYPENDRINFRVMLSSGSTSQISQGIYIVKVHTLDRTSIAKANDYEAIDQEVILSSSYDTDYLLSEIIQIKINKESYVYDELDNYFNIEAYSIGTYNYNDFVSNTSRVIKCHQGYKYSFNSIAHPSNSSLGNILEAYIGTKELTAINGDKKSLKAGNSFSKTFNLATAYYSNNNYMLVTQGLADYYVGASGAISGYWAAASYDYPDWFNVRLLDDNGLLRQSQYEAYSRASWDNVKLSKHESDSNFYSQYTWKDSIDVSSTSYSNYGYTRADANPIDDYFKISGSNLTFEIFNGNNNKDEFQAKNWTITTSIIDRNAPTIIGSYILDNNSYLNRNDKLKVGIRFSEPIQILNGDISLYLYLGSNPIELKLSEGKGTNTLIFESTESISNLISSTIINTSKITNMELHGNGKIRDYSSPDNIKEIISNKENYLSNSEYNISSNIDFIVDTRTPDINLNINSINSVSKSKDISIFINNVTEEGLKVEYKFIPEAELKTINFNSLTDLNKIENKANISFTDGDRNGSYFLYIRVTTLYGKVIDNSNYRNDESYLLKYDNTPPKITDLKYIRDENNFTKYNIYFKMTNGPYEDISNPLDAISRIKLIYSESKISLNSNISEKIIYSDSSSTQNIYKFQYISDENDEYYGYFKFELNASDFNISENEYIDYYLGIVGIDKCSNQTDFTNIDFKTINIRFDRRNKLTGSIKIDGELIDDDLKNSYNLEVYKANTTLTYTLGDDVIGYNTFSYSATMYEKNSNGDMIIKEIINPKEYYEATLNNKVYTIEFKKSGYYEVIFDIDKAQYSDTYSIYISENMNDQTDNNYNNPMIINKVYTVLDTNFYYFDSINHVTSIRYNNSLGSQMFSSYSLLRDYLKYYEYNDLYLEVLTAESANSLRSGVSSTYKMASSERQIPEKNQLWIRYKKSSWNFSSSSTEWVYYYYGQYSGGELIIDINNLSVNLKSAINSVVDTILSNYSIVNLVTDDYLVNGVPYISLDRIHPNEEILENTLLNIKLLNAVFSGDNLIYSGYYEDDASKQYLLASNIRLDYNKYTHIFIKGENSLRELDSSFSNLELKEILDEGKYSLIEVDENGYSIRLIYIIKEAPSLITEILNKNNNIKETLVLNSNNNNEIFNVKEFNIKSLGDSIDKYAYITIYQYNNTSRYNVYYRDDLNNNIVLNSGKYIIEVGDRFNNYYQFIVQINNEDISFDVSIVENEYIRTRSSLNIEDIFLFEVYLNGKLQRTAYQQELLFKESGLYRFIIEDVYGNTYDQSFELVRKYPETLWYYEYENNFINLNENPLGAILEEKSNNSFVIYTNNRLQFTFDGSGVYNYEIVGDANVLESTAYGLKRVTLSDFKNIIIRIYYVEFEECYSEYSIIFDNEAPLINGYVKANEYKYDDKNYNDPSFDFSKIDSINYELVHDNDGNIIINNFPIINNGQIYSNILNFEFNDDIGLAYLKVIINDKTILELTNNIPLEYIFKENDDNYEYELYGKYEIICKDKLGNTNTFTFNNQKPDYYSFYLDESSKDIVFDPSISYQNSLYGHEGILYCFNNISEISFIIDKKYYSFILDDGILKRLIWNNNSYDSIVILDSNNSLNNNYIDVDRYNGINIKARYLNNSFYLYLTTLDEEIHLIYSRALSDLSYIPFYSKIELYNKEPNLDFINSQNEQISFGNNISYYNDLFNISKNDDNITSILYSYSDVESFDNYNEIINNIDLATFKYGDKDGYYSFIVTNKYGNKISYTIIISRVLLVEVSINYKDNYIINYSANDDTTYYTNYLSTIRVNSMNSNVTILKDNRIFEYNKNIYDSYYDIVLNGDGIYSIEVIDENNNIRKFTIEINSDSFEIDNNILYGFNNDALRKDDLYTNKKLSINKNLLSNQIYLINMEYNGINYVLYDNISLNKINDDKYLNEFIGSLGSGIYKLYFRNKYGNYSLKEVHYQKEDVFNITRMTRSDSRGIDYSLALALSDGVYSNNVVTLNTLAKDYILKVDGVAVNASYELKFPSNTLIGNYNHLIEYVDEYGFKYEFNVYLIRQDIDYTLSIDDISTIDGVITVNKNFSINFDQEFNATYLIDNNEYSYLRNEIISHDGSYLFTISDRAGNSKRFTIRKDSIVDFQIKEILTDRILVDGDISNSNQVTLLANNGDNINVIKAYLNGVLVSNPSSIYTDNGKWELLVSDNVGNLRYTYFYIFTHAISSFEYTTPYNYEITEITYRDLDGNRISYIDNVNKYDYYSTVRFELNGNYNVIMKSKATGESSSFIIDISNIKPDIKLIGVENGGETANNVQISGYHEGDTILIYKNKALIQTIKVTSNDMTSPEISEMGDYVIEIVNTEGNKTTLEFRRTYTANTASSIFVIVVLVGVAVVLFIGLFSRKREKIE